MSASFMDAPGGRSTMPSNVPVNSFRPTLRHLSGAAPQTRLSVAESGARFSHFPLSPRRSTFPARSSRSSTQTNLPDSCPLHPYPPRNDCVGRHYRLQMIALYIASFIAGLLIGVAVMLFGIEGRSRTGGVDAGVSLRRWIPLAAAFAIGFGVAGYSFSRALSPTGALVASLAIGGLTAGLVRWLVSKSESMPVEHDIDDERYVLQGHVARVVSSIASGEEGRISFDYEIGRAHV